MQGVDQEHCALLILSCCNVSKGQGCPLDILENCKDTAVLIGLWLWNKGVVADMLENPVPFLVFTVNIYSFLYYLIQHQL